MCSFKTLLPALLFGIASGNAVLAQFGVQQEVYREGPVVLQVVDIDADGQNDLLIGAREGVSCLMNDNGSLGTSVLIGPTAVVAHAADVNGDGLIDVIGGGEGQGGIFWFENGGPQGFVATHTISTWQVAKWIHAWDADQDGDKDLLFALNGGTIAWSENTDGLGAFAALEVLETVMGMSTVNAFDVDLDGDLDPVISALTIKQLFWIPNNSGVFAPMEVLSAQGYGMVGDVDGDGLADLMMANDLNAQMQWERRVADTYVPAGPVDPNGLIAERFSLTDLDGDGDRDLVVALELSNEIAVYENIDGQGTYGPREVIGTGLGDVRMVTAGDMDGDGDKEIFVACGSQNKVVWFENLRFAQDRIVGRVFNDRNGDGVFNATDHGMYNITVVINGLGTTATNHSGVFSFDVAPGTYTVEAVATNGWSFVNGAQRSATVAPPQNCALNVDFAMIADQLDPEVVPVLTSAPLLCDRITPYWLVVTNTGNQVSDVRATVMLDARSTFVSSDPVPNGFISGQPYWDIPALQPTQSRVLDLRIQMPDVSHMGATMVDQASVTVMDHGIPVADAISDLQQVMNCAYDPNDKLVEPVGAGEDHLTAMGSTLIYTIRFQNTGTAPAEDVRLEDQLDPSLDLSSFRFLASSHAAVPHLDPTGLLIVDLNKIFLPDSASDLAGSQGFVKFSLDHLPGLPEGTLVQNQADIFFDMNPAITTNVVENTLSYGLVSVPEVGAAGQVIVSPNPMHEEAFVHLGVAFEQGASLLMTDAVGRTVRTWNANGDRVHLERDGLGRGTYILRAFSRTGTEQVVRVVMQ